VLAPVAAPGTAHVGRRGSLFLNQINPILTMLQGVDYLSHRGHFGFMCTRREGDRFPDLHGDSKDRTANKVDLS
jgi:hypothetical protein